MLSHYCVVDSSINESVKLLQMLVFVWELFLTLVKFYFNTHEVLKLFSMGIGKKSNEHLRHGPGNQSCSAPGPAGLIWCGWAGLPDIPVGSLRCWAMWARHSKWPALSLSHWTAGDSKRRPGVPGSVSFCRTPTTNSKVKGFALLFLSLHWILCVSKAIIPIPVSIVPEI